MAIDIKEKIQEIVEKIQSDKDLKQKFKNDPISAIEGLIGVDLPNDQIEKIVDAVKAKIDIDSIGDKLGALGKLFK